MGVGPNLLREFFEDGRILHAMVSDLERYYRGEREGWRVSHREANNPNRAEDSDMESHNMRLSAKTDKQQRATEGRLQASRQNSVEDSGPRGRGGRESTIGGALQGTDDGDADPEEGSLYSEEGSTDGDDGADEVAPGETDDEGERHADSEDEF